MRDRQLRLGQAARDRLLHRSEIDDLNISLCYSRGGCSGDGLRDCGSRSGCSGTLLDEILDVIAHDTSTRTGTLELAQIDAMLLSNAPRERGRLDKGAIATLSIRRRNRLYGLGRNRSYTGR